MTLLTSRTLVLRSLLPKSLCGRRCYLSNSSSKSSRMTRRVLQSLAVTKSTWTWYYSRWRARKILWNACRTLSVYRLASRVWWNWLVRSSGRISCFTWWRNRVIWSSGRSTMIWWRAVYTSRWRSTSNSWNKDLKYRWWRRSMTRSIVNDAITFTDTLLVGDYF
jgi:hypothetical protein